jgi:hypothetical protein
MNIKAKIVLKGIKKKAQERLIESLSFDDKKLYILL